MYFEKATTDWLGSNPIFYNEKTKLISDNILEVIDYTHMQFHAEGLCNYLRYGYSTMGQTMVQNVKILPPNSSIEKKNNELIISYIKEPFEFELGRIVSNSKDVLEQMFALIEEKQKNTEIPIILPLSGGYDSRFLAIGLRKCKNVHAYTYGVCQNQELSYEVQNAREISKRCELEWHQIELGDFHNKIDEWYSLYGPSVHLHGMYQMEFYEKIKQEEKGKKCLVISGIYGDLWAGNINIPLINSECELDNLMFTHGIGISNQICKLKDNKEIKNQFLIDNKQHLKNDRWRLLLMAREKINLLSYLIKVPSYYGNEVWSPFLNYKLVLNMLNLPNEEFKNRKWQTDFLHREGYEIPVSHRYDYSNTLDLVALRQQPLEPLNSKLLSSIIDKDYVEFINKNITSRPLGYLPWTNKRVNGCYNSMIHLYNKKIRKAYNSYIILKPIQMLMEKAEGI